MSWNRRAFRRGRPEPEEPEFSFGKLFNFLYSDYSWDDPWEDDYWWEWDYYNDGCPQNMGEYHQLKLLTLLGRFNLRTARVALKERNW